MKILASILLAFAIIISALSCKGGHAETESHEKEKEHVEHDDHSEEGKIHLTKEQIKTVGITLGDLTSIKINDYIKTNGTLGLPPQSYASISAKANGFIKNSFKYVEGSYVKKGATLAYLENPDFISRQQEYLEVLAELTYLQQELDRQQKLVDANAGVIKNVQKLQSEVNKKTATINGIAKQLAYLGINVKDLKPENIVDRISIKAPMSGYVTSINIHNGMYVTPEMVLIELAGEDHLHLELDVFEKDIANLKEKQKISYTVPSLGNKVYTGEVHIIRKEFNTENKTVRIHGHLDKERPTFIKGLFVDAKIWLNDQTVQAIPEDAIIKDGTASYIYITNASQDNEEVEFQRVMVIPGTSDKGFTSVKLLNEIPENMKIVTGGAYYVYAQSKAGELEHEH